MLLENNIRGGIGSVMGCRYVKSDENKKIIYMDAKNLYGHSMSQLLPFDEIRFEKDICLEEVLNTADDTEVGFIFEVDLEYPDSIKTKQRIFQFVLKIKLFLQIIIMII